MTTIIPIESREQWLRDRAQDVTSTEVAALFGLSPYVTEFELWHQKRANQVVAIDETERMTWGKRLEDAIARGIAEDRGWSIEGSTVYARMPELRLGASFDYFIRAQGADGDGVLEIKNVDAFIFGQQWEELGGGGYKAPDHIELQHQTQLLVSGCKWGAIVALVGGNEVHCLLRRPDELVAAEIEMRVGRFWRTIEANQEPAPDFDRDTDFIAKVLRRSANAGTRVNADKDIALTDACRDYADAWKQRCDAEARCERAKGRILMLAGDAARIDSTIAGGHFNLSETKPVEPTTITADMVGTTYGGRNGFRQFRYYPKEK